MEIARVSAVLEKGREEDRTCYRPLSKLMESCVASKITNHVVTQNLLDNRQWAYGRGKSTEQLLKHLTERWRVVLVRSCWKCSEVLRIQVKFTPTHAIPLPEATGRLLHKSDTAISYIRSDSVGIVQQDAHKQPGETPCKGWTGCILVAMGH